MSGSDPEPHRKWDRVDSLAVVGVVALALVLWFVRRHGPAWSMEEAMMLQAPSRVLDGAVPGRDFDYFYGPLSLLIPAGAYSLTSPSLIIERLIGAGYVAIIGAGLYAIGRRWSRWIGLAMAGIAVLVGALSLTALPIMGAIGGLVLTVAFAVSGLGERPKAWAVGLAAATAVLLRPDFLMWALVLLAVLSLIRAVRPSVWIAGAVGLVPYLWLVIAAGWSTTWRNLVTDAAHVASERHLPWHANLGSTGSLAIIGAVTSLVAAIVGVRRRHDQMGIALLGLGLIGLCLIPEYLQRADGVHVFYVTIVPLATIVPVSYELLGASSWLRTRAPWRLQRRPGAGRPPARCRRLRASAPGRGR